MIPHNNYSYVSRQFRDYLAKKIITRVDIDPDDASILATEDPTDTPPDQKVDKEFKNAMITEALDYSPAIGNFASPIAPETKDITDMSADDSADDSLLQTEEDTKVEHPLVYTNGENRIPSDVVDYYNESTSDLPDAKDDQTPKIYGFEVPSHKRTKEQIVKEHMEMNGLYYNSLFYSDEFAREMKLLKEYEFFNFFYPSFTTHNFYSRLKSSLGGLSTDHEIYKLMGIRYPLPEDFTTPLGEWNKENQSEVQLYIESSYTAESNWYKADVSDIDHITYCLELYSILGDIMNNPHFHYNDITAHHVEIISSWLDKVITVYQDMDHNKIDTVHMQQLHDLFWNFNTNPMSEHDAMINIMSMCHNMSVMTDTLGNISEATELLSKQDCAAYMIKELGMDDDIFLLPTTMEYPIINKSSVKLAMDMITRIEKEKPDQVKEYTDNLNRKYKEFGCTFSISVDHPYAKYADKSIIEHMIHILMEGDTAVSDEGTSVNKSDRATTEPWYKRLDYTGTVARNLLDNKELGPNDKKYSSLDYERTEAFL